MLSNKRDFLSEVFSWAYSDLNGGQNDYAYYYDFHHPFPVCGLEYTLPFGFAVYSLHLPYY